jgi:hypothetical protein
MIWVIGCSKCKAKDQLIADMQNKNHDMKASLRDLSRKHNALRLEHPEIWKKYFGKGATKRLRDKAEAS